MLFIILDWIFRVKFIERERDVFNRLTVCMSRTWEMVVTVATQRSKITHLAHPSMNDETVYYSIWD